MNDAAERLKKFYEKALFKQEPFKYTLETRGGRNFEQETYSIYDESNTVIYRAIFSKYASTDLNEIRKTIATFNFENKDGDMHIVPANREIVFRLFTTLIKLMKEYFKKNIFDYMKFSAYLEEPSRVKLYDAIFNKFKKEYSSDLFFETNIYNDFKKYYITYKTSDYDPINKSTRG